MSPGTVRAAVIALNAFLLSPHRARSKALKQSAVQGIEEPINAFGQEKMLIERRGRQICRPVVLFHRNADQFWSQEGCLLTNQMANLLVEQVSRPQREDGNVEIVHAHQHDRVGRTASGPDMKAWTASLHQYAQALGHIRIFMRNQDFFEGMHPQLWQTGGLTAMNVFVPDCMAVPAIGTAHYRH